MAHGELRHLFGDWLALGFIGVQNRLAGPALHPCGQQPREVQRVGNAGVHAVTRVRHPDVRRVPRQKHPAAAKPVCHQTPANPVFLAQHLVVEVGAHTQNVADALVAVHRVKLGFIGAQVVVDQPVVMAIDGKHRAATARVHGVTRPGRFAGDHRHQLRRADVGGLHALDDGCAFKPGADLFAHVGASAIAAHQVGGADVSGAAVVKIQRGGDNLVGILFE